MDKITVVGAGHVGATSAMRIAEAELARDVVLVDIKEGLPQGIGLDQWESAPVRGFDTRLTGAQSYEDTSGSGIVVVTAGFARKPGMSRDDLVAKNAAVVSGIAAEIRDRSPDAIIIMVTNPLDVMAFVARQVTGFQRERVVGMAGVLDTARFRSFISLELDVSVRDIQALVLGGHGDSMVPIVSTVTVGGVPLTQLLSRERIEALVQRTRKGGGEIVGLLKEGSAYYAPSAAAAQMCEAIVRDQKRILPCAAWLEGEYGLEGLFVGVPCKLGRGGVEAILEVELTDEEQAALERSAAAVLETMESVRS
ncbi:MAG: malate dehydrogenase [Candidatus Palauibacterales bacterium]|nr:malate dehydrogenase [Candidatus Palauibacterales bacterium]MDP2529328.1 malate dehydrogenase [Candidatus Palauibacterales bacterium]MDP2583265.1 malate dehydrogenase [Candidatus Palauibacterales bacterium]